MSVANNNEVMSKLRIEAFSDNVFSIVLTLLVFSFKLPKLEEQNFNQELYEKLWSMRNHFLAYVISFILINMFWIAHHKLFHSLKHSNTTLLWLNNLFLLFLVLLPFPTEVLNIESAAVFFGIVMILVSLSFSLLRYYCYFRSGLVDDSVTTEYRHGSLIKGLVGVTLYIIAIAAAVYSPDITLTMYALIPFLYFVNPYY